MQVPPFGQQKGGGGGGRGVEDTGKLLHSISIVTIILTDTLRKLKMSQLKKERNSLLGILEKNSYHFGEIFR